MRMIVLSLLGALTVPLSAAPKAPEAKANAQIAETTREISATNIEATIRKLVSFGRATRSRMRPVKRAESAQHGAGFRRNSNATAKNPMAGWK